MACGALLLSSVVLLGLRTSTWCMAHVDRTSFSCAFCAPPADFVLSAAFRLFRKVFVHYNTGAEERHHTIKITLPKKWNDGPVSNILKVCASCLAACAAFGWLALLLVLGVVLACSQPSTGRCQPSPPFPVGTETLRPPSSSSDV